jgi:hypothetical protein
VNMFTTVLELRVRADECFREQGDKFSYSMRKRAFFEVLSCFKNFPVEWSWFYKYIFFGQICSNKSLEKAALPIARLSSLTEVT